MQNIIKFTSLEEIQLNFDNTLALNDKALTYFFTNLKFLQNLKIINFNFARYQIINNFLSKIINYYFYLKFKQNFR